MQPQVLFVGLIMSFTMAGCATEDMTPSQNQEFSFTVDPTASSPEDRIKPTPPGKKGLYKGGYARIKLNKHDSFSLEWLCPAPNLKIEIKALDWSAPDPLPQREKLSQKFESANPADPEIFQGVGSVKFALSKKNVGTHETDVYKYDLYCDGLIYDPVIIINR